MIGNKMTVTVGIPAHNEELNIGFLLRDLLAQALTSFELEKIIVYSDCSSDGTVAKARELSSSKIEVIEGQTRLGVAEGQNQIIKRTNSDILVLIDADIKIPVPNFLEEFLAPFLNDAPDLVSCSLKSLPPKRFFEKIVSLGVDYKNEIFENFKDGQNLFTCHGAARAFSKKMYANFEFPESLGEDMYSYFYVRAKNLKYVFNKATAVYHKLPDNFKDHLNQSFRFFYAKAKIPQEFMLEKSEQVPFSLFFTKGIKYFFLHPILSTVYLLVTTAVILSTKLRLVSHSNTWDVVASSKTLGDK
jgi:glycosyltransferase involved in cell wall biosynthesis